MSMLVSEEVNGLEFINPTDMSLDFPNEKTAAVQNNRLHIKAYNWTISFYEVEYSFYNVYEIGNCTSPV